VASIPLVEAPAMNFRARAALRVLAKEIREARRDRNLVIGLVLVPLFLYPVVGLGIVQIVYVTKGIAERRPTRVAVGSDVPARIVERLRARENFAVVEAGDGAWNEAAFRAEREARKLDALLVWAGEDSAVVYHDQSRDRSVAARDAVREELEKWGRSLALGALADVGLGEGDYDLWRLVEEDTASAAERGKRILASALPMILLLMLGLGTFYSALDAVVGERERGTLETILTSPLRRAELLLGKYVFVVLASVVALVLNLASMTIFLGFVLKLLDVEGVSLQVSPEAFLLIVVTALFTAAFLAAVLMVIAIPSKTYREGQAVLTPFYFATFIPGLMVSTSNDPFSLRQAAIPLLNSVALFKSALLGELPAGPILVTLAVLAAATGLALAVASRIVGREEVYLDPRVTLRGLLALAGRRNR
jgi:sodium transport system permease protein